MSRPAGIYTFGPTTERHRLAQNLHSEGLGFAAIGAQMGVTRQRAEQLVRLDRHRARMAVKMSKARGDLLVASLCERCKLPRRLQGHHPDYTNRTTVTWLCNPCHNIVHPHPNPKGNVQAAGA